MNVCSTKQLDLACQISKVIRLGASSKDLIKLFPSYFYSNNSKSEKAAIEKALRVSNDLKPQITPLHKPGRQVSFHTIFSKRQNRKKINNFIKYCANPVRDADLNDDLGFLFIELYEAWVKKFGKEESLTFQQALSVFQYYLVATTLNKPEVLFTKCKKCKTYHFTPKHDLLIDKHICSYC